LSKVLEHYLDPDGVQPREETAKAKRGAFLRPNGDGTQTLRWVETDENIALLQAALEPLSAPRPAEDGTKDTRSPALRRADGLVDLVAMTLRHGELPASRGARPHLVVTITEPALRSDRGLGITPSGEHLSNAAVKRISCDADLTAIRLDTNGVPLSMGRTRRTVSPAQWLALVARDKGCVFTDCTRPPGWTQAHSEALDPARTDRSRESGPALQSPPRLGAPRPMGNRHGNRRPTGVDPTTLDRLAAKTQTQQALGSSGLTSPELTVSRG
jgi:hypothetical protein